MSKPHNLHIPFTNLSPDAWRKLGLVAIFVFYILNFVFAIFRLGILNGVGGDFLAFWSSGKIADLYGYSQIYNLDFAKEIQYQAVSYLKIPFESFEPIPVPYFAFSIIPFQFLSRINVIPCYWIWTIANFCLLAGYLFFFLRKLTGQKRITRKQATLLISLMLIYPVFVNFVVGQVEVFPVICCGEFIRHSLQKRPLLAGVWLGGLLIKPQILILVIPALLLMKNWKVFTGFLVSAISLMLLSVMLTGVNNLRNLILLWSTYVPSNSSNSPFAMANWRMLAENINNWTGSSFGWIPAGAGMLFTLIIWVLLSKNKFNFGSGKWISNFMALLVASCAFTWHSHIHMGMVIIPFLIYLMIFEPMRRINLLVDLTVFAFPAFLMVGYIASLVLIVLKIPPVKNLDFFLSGLTGLCLYIFIATSELFIQKPIETSGEKISG
jgi:hypothetical protein